MRAFAVFLVIWAQLFAGCLQGNLVACVHEDGSMEIELAAARCCDVELALSEAVDEDCGDGRESTDCGADDCCQDFLLGQPQQTVLQSEADPDHPQPDTAQGTAGSALPTLAGTDPMFRAQTVRDRGPPGLDVLRRSLRTVQLRC